MSISYYVYIDESGDEGFSFGRGSSDWFIVSAIVVKSNIEGSLLQIVDDVRAKLNKPSKIPLHFRDLRHEQRLLFIDRIASANLNTISVLLHKPSLHEPELFQTKYHLYYHLVRYLLERVSWFCRDHHTMNDIGDGSAEVIFSNRAGMPYEEMRNYLTLLEQQTGIHDIRIEWSIIRPDRILAFTAGKRVGLQIADAVASSCYYAVQPSQYGFTEDRYLRMLKPTIYHRRGMMLGYGLKFWPKEVNGQSYIEELFGQTIAGQEKR